MGSTYALREEILLPTKGLSVANRFTFAAKPRRNVLSRMQKFANKMILLGNIALLFAYKTMPQGNDLFPHANKIAPAASRCPLLISSNGN